MRFIFFPFLLMFLASCSGASLINGDPSPNLSGDLASLQVMTVHHDSSGNALLPNSLGEKEFETDLGFHIRLQEGRLNWASLNLISSGEDPECAGGNDQPIALNHGEDFLGQDLLAEIVATANVPKVGYCEFEMTLGPSPASALKFHEGEEHPEGDGDHGLDFTVHLKGVWEKGAASGDFEITATQPVEVHGHFHAEEAGEILEHPLHFHEGEGDAAVTFACRYDTLLNGIDFNSEGGSAQASKVLENLQGGIEQQVGEEPNQN